MALSSGEAEKVVATMCSDASAATGMAHCQGFGKTRQNEVQYLWIQHQVKEGKLTVKKVGTDNSPSGPLDKSDEWREGNEVHGGDGV